MHNDIEGIAFDLDGALYPNYSLNIRLLPFVLKEWRLLSAFGKTREIIRRKQEEALTLNSQPSIPQGGFYEYQADITAKILGVPAQPLKEKIERLMYKGWEPLFKNIKLYKNVIKTLAGFKNAGFKLGLLSDFPPETKLEYLKISGIWDVVHCSERSGTIKPHPLSFLKLAEDMGMPCGKILYVGNSYSYDVKGASRAGMKTAWIRSPLVINAGGKKPKPDFSFSSYRQLQKFMLE